MNKGIYKEEQLFSPEIYSKMIKPYAAIGKKNMKMGLGWFVDEYNGTRRICHTGGDTGFRSNLVILPEQDMALVLMVNCGYIDVKAISNAIFETINEDTCSC